jgi:DNA helicase MCM9
MFVQKVFEPEVSEEADEILQTYYQFLRQNERISKDRKTVRMLESLIRLSQAHARMYMKNTVSVFDAISVVILMEHTLVSCLFGFDKTPSVFFDNEVEYGEARDTVLCALELDLNKYSRQRRNETGKRSRTPSPIKRLEEDTHNMFFNDNSNLTT